MSRPPKGVALLEAIVATAVLASVLAALWPLMLQLPVTLRQTHASERLLSAASGRLWLYSTFSRHDLERRLGTTTRDDGFFEVVSRGADDTFEVSIVASDGHVVLSTRVFAPAVRPDGQ